MKRHSLFFAGVFCLLLISFISPASAYENQKKNAPIYVTVDITPPKIENVRATDIGLHSADVKWDTDEPGTSLVKYWKAGSPEYPENKSKDNLVQSHSVRLSGLAQGTYYKYRVRSVDSVGNGNWSENFSFRTETVPPPPPSFSLSVTPSALSIEPGDSKTVQVDLRSFRGYSGTVELFIENLDGVSAEFNPENGVPAFTSTLGLRVAENLSFGSYELTINASGILGNKSTTLLLHVVPRSHFKISVSPSSASVAQGGSIAGSVDLESIRGYENMVSLSAENVPAGMNISFQPQNGVPPFESQMSVTAENNLVPSTYSLRVRGVGTGGTTFSKPYDLTVNPSPTVVRNAKSASVENAHPGSPVVIRPENMSIASIHLIPKDTIYNARLSVRELIEKPGGVSPSPPPLYKYIVLSGENLSGDQIENNLISFKVEWSWIKQNKVDSKTVSMYRYNLEENLWERIPTRIIGSNENYISYLASAPGLTTHAISAGAFFELSDLTVPKKVMTGKAAEVKVKVTNAGSVQGTYSANLEVDNKTVDYQGTTLDSGESQTISLHFTQEEADTYQVKVDGLTGKVIFEKPAPIPYFWIFAVMAVVIIFLGAIWWRFWT